MHALPLREVPALDELLTSLPARGRFCLDGDRGHPEGRWTFLGAEPAEVLALPWGSARPLDALSREGAPGDGVAPLSASQIPWWVTTIAYDAAWSDPAASSLRCPLRLPRPDRPVVWLGRYSSLIAIDDDSGRGWALGETRAEAQRLRDHVERACVAPARRQHAKIGAVHGEDPDVHRARIRAALEAIAAGDIYQVNLARPWRARYAGSPIPLWGAMRSASQVPLGMFVESGERAVIARTMERFLRWDRASRRLWTSPIKGTIARRGDDVAEARALKADTKERAEHSMIVDLMRNDLSRVAQTGSVRVIDPLRVEPFRGLHHLVSTVECKTRDGIDAGAILAATFPPGSVTGTPKLRAMELIESHESTARGLYTGALGYLDRDGGMSLAVAIRTAVIESEEAVYFAGGGLVSASDVERELEETELKARVFLDAIRAASKNNSD